MLAADAPDSTTPGARSFRRSYVDRGQWTLVKDLPRSEFTGYNELATATKIVAIRSAGEQADVAGDVPALTVVETHATSKDGTPLHLFVLSGSGTPDAPRPEGSGSQRAAGQRKRGRVPARS